MADSVTMAVPPKDILETIDKTVQYVQKNGTTFEKRLRESNDSDKFSFLDPNDQYNPYYNWKLNGGQDEKKQKEVASKEENSETNTIPKPDELSFLTELPPISSLDLDIIKITALFVAQNGPEYIQSLLSHETKIGNKHQFEFLNRTHSLHNLFQKYIKQYTIILHFFKDDEKSGDEEIIKLQEKLKRSDDIFKTSFERGQYNKLNKEHKQNEIKEKQEDLSHYASIDWQDFSIVAKVGFNSIDEVTELAMPLSRDELIYRSLQSKNEELKLQVEPIKETKKDQENVKDSKEFEQRNKIIHPKMKGMKIKAAGESRLKNRKSQLSAKSSLSGFIKCPLTNKLVEEDKFDNHLKVLLRDPRYKEQQDNFMKKNFKYESNLTTDQVYENIKRLSKKRSIEDEESDKQANVKKSQIGPFQVIE